MMAATTYIPDWTFAEVLGFGARDFGASRPVRVPSRQTPGAQIIAEQKCRKMLWGRDGQPNYA